jgi:beta-lactam-binding protein with PASTA domain
LPQSWKKLNKNMDRTKRKVYLYYAGIGLGIVLVVAFITSQILMPLFFGRAKSVQVPYLKSMNLAKASSLLFDKKIHAVVKDSIWSDEIKSGDVVSQKPESGEMIKPDGTVYLIISRGSKYVKVPYIIGLNVQAAWITLKNKGLSFAVIDSIESTTYPPNTVISNMPAAGERAEKNSRIQIVISKSIQTVTPDTSNVISDFQY